MPGKKKDTTLWQRRHRELELREGITGGESFSATHRLHGISDFSTRTGDAIDIAWRLSFKAV